MIKKEDFRENIMRKYNRIAKVLQIHHYTISHVVQCFSQTKSIARKSGGGRIGGGGFSR